MRVIYILVFFEPLVWKIVRLVNDKNDAFFDNGKRLKWKMLNQVQHDPLFNTPKRKQTGFATPLDPGLLLARRAGMTSGGVAGL